MTSRIWRFSVVGVANTAIGMAVLYGALFAGLGDYVSNALGYGVGLIVSFLLHRGWTFAGRTRTLLRDAAGFGLVWVIAYLTNFGIIAAGRSLGFIENPIVQLTGVLVFAGTFYLLTSRVVFVGSSDGQ
jgi:putative flippase GtrA